MQSGWLFYFQKGGEEIANNYEGIKTQKFGIEIETTGLTRAKAAKAVAKHFNTTAEHLGGSLPCNYSHTHFITIFLIHFL